MAYSVLLVEDHKIMRDGIRALLDRSGEFTVVGDAEGGSEAVQLCIEIHPDIVLMDIGLPGLNGVETTTELLRQNPGPWALARSYPGLLSRTDSSEPASWP